MIQKTAQVGESPEVQNQGNRSWRGESRPSGKVRTAGRPGPTPQLGTFQKRECGVRPHRQLPQPRSSGAHFPPRPSTFPHWWEVVTARTRGETAVRTPGLLHSRSFARPRPSGSPALALSQQGSLSPIGRRLLGQPITGGGVVWREAVSRVLRAREGRSAGEAGGGSLPAARLSVSLSDWAGFRALGGPVRILSEEAANGGSPTLGLMEGGSPDGSPRTSPPSLSRYLLGQGCSGTRSLG